MRSTLPPMPPLEVAKRLPAYNDQLVAIVATQAMHREHATEREGLRIATDEMRRWHLAARAKRTVGDANAG